MAINKKKHKTKSKSVAFDILNEKMMTMGNPKKSIPKVTSNNEKKIVIPSYINEIKDLLKKFHPLDLFKTILIAETYIENVNGFVKFSLLFEVFFSINLEEFGHERITSYEDFSRVLISIYKIIPHNEMIEDFYSIDDWGQVKYQLGDKSYKILYGSCLTDSYSYFKSFELCYSHNKQAYNDLKNVVENQDNLLSNVNQKVSKSRYSSELSIPSIDFRDQMLNWLENVNTNNDNEDLIITNGVFLNHNKDFYSRYMDGEVNLYCYFKYEDRLYPFSIRNHICVLVEKYHLRNIDVLNNTSNKISLFLDKNIKKLICGNFRIRTEKSIFENMFSGVLESGDKTYFILPLNSDELTKLASLIGKIKNIMSDPDWGIQKPYTNYGFQPRDIEGGVLTFQKIRIIVVLTELTTRNHLIPQITEDNIEITSINEFIAVVDSMESDNELDEFVDYYKANQIKTIFFGFNLDGFSSFKDSHGLLEDGATSFSMIMVDTHSAPQFRYEYLIEKYGNLPENLPKNDNYQWSIKSIYDGNYCLISKNHNAISWSTIINRTSIHFLFDFHVIDLSQSDLNPQVLELFCEAAADSLSQRQDYLKDLNSFDNITVKLLIGITIEKAESEFQPDVDSSIFVDYQKVFIDEKKLDLNVYLDLEYCFYNFRTSINAKFQNEICVEFLKIINDFKKIENLDSLIDSLSAANELPLRMTMGSLSPRFDVIEETPEDIKEIYFKRGRQSLARILKSNGILPDKYKDFSKAKEIINDASSKFREEIHHVINSKNIMSILEFALYDYSVLVSYNYLSTLRQEMSLKHEVSYSRSERLAKLDSDFKRNSQIYRYLIECTLMLDSSSHESITKEEYLNLLGSINWLLNMYHSSDGLHYDVGVEGIEIDFSYIPEIIMSEATLSVQDKYNEELSSYKLGIGLNSADELSSIIPNDNYKLIDSAFYEDLGFGFRNLFTVLYCLSNWGRWNNIEKQAFYKLPFNELVQTAFDMITNPEVSIDELENIIRFLIIDSSKINILEGIETPQFDVPVSDHSKRTNRLNIKPLISFNNEIIWSPACTHRALGIWTTHTTDGYLPADFNFPTVNKLVDDSKTVLEKQLETKAFDILSRYTSYIESGIDLKKKFKKENYPDIGDYDVLAFVPESNCWIMVECKYNQPAYCLKDMSRLRQRIFGKDQNDKSQISKVKRRYDFLLTEHNKIRNSIQWPEPNSLDELKIINLYVSKNTYWWFRCPPYEVNINFVQVDYLEEWLKNNLDTHTH